MRKYVVDIPLFYLTGQLVIDKSAFNKISASDQTIMLEVMNSVMRKLGKMNREDDAEARTALQNQGIKFLTINAEEQHRLHNISNRTIEALGKKNIFTQNMYNLLSQYLHEFRDRDPTAGQHNP